MKDLQRRQLQTKLSPFRSLPAPPKQGWIHEIRRAMGMSTYQLARRIRVSQPVVTQYENSEAKGAITLNTLRKAAAALECELVYALVPRISFQETLKQRACQVAQRMVDRVSHSMDLEAQGVSNREIATQVDDLARELLTKRPRALWDEP
ncbi:MAG: mobile mystery protein A [Gemmatimonadales bacterium]